MSKAIKPVKAWGLFSEKHGILRANLKRYWLRNIVPIVNGKPVLDTKIVRVEIRVIAPKKKVRK